MLDAVSRRTFDSFRDRSLPKPEWTHEAHLRVCWVALQTRSPADTVSFLQQAIRSYNVATGVENTATSGYHETVTRYFVDAVSALGAATIDEVIGADQCDKNAPLRHWSRELLFSAAARAHWVEPNLASLPWTATMSTV